MAQFLPQRKEPGGSWGLAELEESLAVTSKSRRLGEPLKATTGKCWYDSQEDELNGNQPRQRRKT